MAITVFTNKIPLPWCLKASCWFQIFLRLKHHFHYPKWQYYFPKHREYQGKGHQYLSVPGKSLPATKISVTTAFQSSQPFLLVRYFNRFIPRAWQFPISSYALKNSSAISWICFRLEVNQQITKAALVLLISMLCTARDGCEKKRKYVKISVDNISFEKLNPYSIC